MGDSLLGGSERVFVSNNLFGFNTASTSGSGNEQLVKLVGTNSLSVGKGNLTNIDASAQNNTVIGIGEGSNITTSSNNVILGDQALSSQVTGGSNAGKNTAVGVGVLGSALGDYNVGLGYKSGQNVTTGSKNVFIGGTDQIASGSNIDNCICIGHNAGSNNTESIAATSNYAIIGNKNITNYSFVGGNSGILLINHPKALSVKTSYGTDRLLEIDSAVRVYDSLACVGPGYIFCPGIELWSTSATTFNLCPGTNGSVALTTMNYGKSGVTHAFNGTGISATSVTSGTVTTPNLTSGGALNLSCQSTSNVNISSGTTRGNVNSTATCTTTNNNLGCVNLIASTTLAAGNVTGSGCINLTATANNIPSTGTSSGCINLSTFGDTTNGQGIININTAVNRETKIGSLNIKNGDILTTTDINLNLLSNGTGKVNIGQDSTTATNSNHIVISNNLNTNSLANSGNIWISNGAGASTTAGASTGTIRINAGTGGLFARSTAAVTIISGTVLSLTADTLLFNNVKQSGTNFAKFIVQSASTPGMIVGSDQCMYYYGNQDSSTFADNTISTSQNDTVNQVGRIINFFRTSNTISTQMKCIMFGTNNNSGSSITVYNAEITNPVTTIATVPTSNQVNITLPPGYRGFKAICIKADLVSGVATVEWIVRRYYA